FCTALLGILTRSNLNSANHRCLMMNPPPFAARAAANTTFVYLDGMRGANGIAVRAYHTGAEFMKHSKRRLVSDDPKLALKLNSRLSWRLRRHEVSPPKPSRERHVARLHDRPSGERSIFFTGAATQYNRGTGSKPVGLAN